MIARDRPWSSYMADAEWALLVAARILNAEGRAEEAARVTVLADQVRDARST